MWMEVSLCDRDFVGYKLRIDPWHDIHDAATVQEDDSRQGSTLGPAFQFHVFGKCDKLSNAQFFCSLPPH